jgi:ADP-ribosylglycohydrolase
MPTLQDFKRRARGSLIGAAIGDAMGAPCEGLSSQVIRERYGTITDFLSDSSVGTDDTDFTLFNAWMLIQHGIQITSEQVAAEWRDKLLSGRYFYRPGGFSDVISTRNLREGLLPPQSGGFNHQMWSDGVAMAISAAGIISAGRPEQAAHLATVLGTVSNGRDGIYAAQAVAAAISMAMVGATPKTMLDAAQANVPADSWTYRALERARATVEKYATLDEKLAALEREVVVSWYPWADLATEAVPVALAVFAASEGNFRRAVTAGVSMGRDADTIGAIVGSLAGAYAGEDAIPDTWRERVQVSTGACIGFIAGRKIVEMADTLAEKAWEAGA